MNKPKDISVKALYSVLILIILIVSATAAAYVKLDTYVSKETFEKHVLKERSAFKQHTDRISAQMYQMELNGLTEQINYLEDADSTNEITEAGRRQLNRLKLHLKVRTSEWNDIAKEFGICCESILH